MSPEKMPHTPEVKTTPERVLEEAEALRQAQGKKAEVSKERLSPEEIEVRVTELADLSAARPEVSKHVRETWGGLTKKEREELKAKEEETVIAHLESLKVDPELREFAESTLAETDKRIKELASHPDVLAAYKDRFETLKGTLAKVIAFDHLQKELHATENTEQKLWLFYEQYGRSPGPIERKKLEGLANRVTELKEELKGFELDEPTIDMLRRREIRGMQRDLARYSFAETESRTELIREVLPDLIQGAPLGLFGETGTGKSQLAKYICVRYLGKEPFEFDVTEQIKESQILGSGSLEGGETKFKYSPFVMAMKNGIPRIVNELDAAPPEFNTIFNELMQKREGDTWIHPKTGEKIEVHGPLIITANLKSERYSRYKFDSSAFRRLIGGAGAREIHYLDINKKDERGGYIAPETLKILGSVLADRHGNIEWDEAEAPQKIEELKRFVSACRKIQEDFTLSIREGGEETLARTDRLAFRELVITLKDQIEIMKAWKAGGFREPLQQIILREFFHKAEISGRAAKDRENMARVFIANKFFKDTKPEDFKIQGLAAQSLRQWQGKE